MVEPRWVAAVTLLVAAGCASAVPTGTPSMTGDHAVMYDGPELSVLVDTRLARSTVGSEYLAIEVSLRARETSEVLTIGREAISVRTPDRRTLPLMTRTEFRERYGQLAGSASRAAFPPMNIVDGGGFDRSCLEWYFRRPTEGLGRDAVVVSAARRCRGPLFFHVPGGVQPGRWKLEIRLEESTAEVSFMLGGD